MDGSLMITNRKGFHKIFDLTERVIPSNVNTILPSPEEYSKHLIINAINAHGFVSISEICYLRKGVKPVINKLLKQLIEKGEVVIVQTEATGTEYFTTQKQLNLMDTIKDVKNVHILSPFDNLLIQRKRVKDLFGFDYQIECYVPEKKRKFGYYSLPVLFGTNFVARFDAKADRKTKLFNVKKIWFEDGFKPNDVFYKAFSKQLTAFAKFCGCEKISIESSSPSNVKETITSFI